MAPGVEEGRKSMQDLGKKGLSQYKGRADELVVFNHRENCYAADKGGDHI